MNLRAIVMVPLTAPERKRHAMCSSTLTEPYAMPRQPPVDSAIEDNAQHADPSAPELRLAEGRPAPFRVLLVEDDREMRRVVAEALRSDGYEVIELTDGGRFLVEIAALLKSDGGPTSLDLIVSDIRMPVCTGLQILAALRDAHWRTPVILMTAFGDEATHRQAANLGAVLIDKPFEVDDLRTAAAKLLLRDRGPR